MAVAPTENCRRVIVMACPPRVFLRCLYFHRSESKPHGFPFVVLWQPNTAKARRKSGQSAPFADTEPKEGQLANDATSMSAVGDAGGLYDHNDCRVMAAPC